VSLTHASTVVYDADAKVSHPAKCECRHVQDRSIRREVPGPTGVRNAATELLKKVMLAVRLAATQALIIPGEPSLRHSCPPGSPFHIGVIGIAGPRKGVALSEPYRERPHDRKGNQKEQPDPECGTCARTRANIRAGRDTAGVFPDALFTTLSHILQ